MKKRAIKPATTDDPVERFIALIRESDPTYMLDLFQHGGCFHLFRIVQAVFSDAEPWWTPRPGHVFIKVGDAFYDIRGRCKRKPRYLQLVDVHDQEPNEWLEARLRCQYHGDEDRYSHGPDDGCPRIELRS